MQKKEKFEHDVLAKIPWPLTQQYECVYYWMDKDQPVYAALQLRDVWETLIKLLTTLVLAEDIKAIQNGQSLSNTTPIFDLVNSGYLSIGTWVDILIRCLNASQNKSIAQDLLKVIQRVSWCNVNLSDGFVKWRNERLGHGILSQENGIYYTETQKYLELLETCLETLTPFLETLRIFSILPDQTFKIWTPEQFTFATDKTIYPFHPHIAKDSNILLPVYAEIDSKEPTSSPIKLPLSPILSIQKCATCDELSAFFLHGYDSDKKSKPVSFLEFIVQGSLNKRKEEFLQDLAKSAPKKAKEETNQVNPLNEVFKDFKKEVIEVHPMVEQVRQFLQTHTKGLINLTGTGGIGKSWFCRGLESFIKQDCLYIPLQYQARVTINDLLNYLEKYCKNEKKNWIFSKDSISLKDFKNFLPNLLTELKKNVLRKKLVLLLDGLDELPEDSDVLTYLECSPYEIPEGCYILIASRPDLKPKAEILLKNMLAGISNAMRLEMKPEDMEDALQTYIRNQNFPSEWTQAILTKSEKIFLYVFHYCHLLNKKMFDGPNLPDKKDLYTTFFDHLKKCTGEELFRSCYVPLLTVLAVAKEPVSLDQLGSWGIRKDNAEMAIFDIAHFLERETSGKEITYTIRHNDLRDFFQEDKTWRNECQEQEENILRWAKTILEKFVASQELDSEEHYTLEHAIIHWNTVAGKDLQKANEIVSLGKLEMLFLQIAEKLGEKYPTIEERFADLGRSYHLQTEYEKSLGYYKRALDIQLLKLGVDHPDVATTYNNMALVYNDQGLFEQALNYYQKALDIILPKLGIDHPNVATTYNNMAAVYNNQGLFKQALNYYQKALDIILPKLGANHPDVATTYNNMALVYNGQGLFEQALDYGQRALYIQLSKLGADHPDVANTYGNMATVYHHQGLFGQALDYFQKALDIQLPKLGADHPDVATTYTNMAVAYFRQLRWGKAKEYCQKAYNILLAKFGSNHPTTQRCHSFLKECRKKLR